MLKEFMEKIPLPDQLKDWYKYVIKYINKPSNEVFVKDDE